MSARSTSTASSASAQRFSRADSPRGAAGAAVPVRGELWWIAVESAADEARRRPVLIVQIDAFNQSLIRTVVCAVISADLRLRAAPGNVLLPRRVSRLSQDMVCNVSQLITIDKARLFERIGRVPPALQREVDAGLRLVLGI